MSARGGPGAAEASRGLADPRPRRGGGGALPAGWRMLPGVRARPGGRPEPGPPVASAAGRAVRGGAGGRCPPGCGSQAPHCGSAASAARRAAAVRARSPAFLALRGWFFPRWALFPAFPYPVNVRQAPGARCLSLHRQSGRRVRVHFGWRLNDAWSCHPQGVSASGKAAFRERPDAGPRDLYFFPG